MKAFESVHVFDNFSFYNSSTSESDDRIIILFLFDLTFTRLKTILSSLDDVSEFITDLRMIKITI